MSELPGTYTATRRTERAERDTAFRDLYDAHVAQVFRLVLRCGVPPSDADDLVQKVFVVAHRRIGEGESIANLGGWLRGVTLRVVNEHRRWSRVRAMKRWVLEAMGEQRAAGASTPEREVAAGITSARVGEVLEKMSRKLRDVLVLADIEECSPSEISEALGIPINTARSRKRLARESFRTIWLETYGEAAP